MIFRFPRNYRGVMFCEHLIDFRCFCSHFSYSFLQKRFLSISPINDSVFFLSKMYHKRFTKTAVTTFVNFK